MVLFGDVFSLLFPPSHAWKLRCFVQYACNTLGFGGLARLKKHLEVFPVPFEQQLLWVRAVATPGLGPQGGYFGGRNPAGETGSLACPSPVMTSKIPVHQRHSVCPPFPLRAWGRHTPGRTPGAAGGRSCTGRRRCCGSSTRGGPYGHRCGQMRTSW